jgi:hypothetical protein
LNVKRGINIAMLKKFIILFASVTSLLLLCKPAWAEDNSFIDGFTLGGYSNLSLVIPSEKSAQANLDLVSLLLSWENDSRYKFFGELELEHPLTLNHKDGFKTSEAEIDLERLYLDYNLSEKLNLRAGRFLNPIGRWNMLHAAPLVWTTSRPLVTKLLYPSFINGLMLYGSTPLNDDALEYSLFTALAKDTSKDNDDTIYKDVAGAHFALTNGYNLGLTIATYEDTASSDRYNLIGLDFITHLDRWEFSGEAYARLKSNDKDGGGGGYLQSAYNLGDEWYWITRLESINHPNKAGSGRWLLGATKRLKPNQLLKFEFVGGSDDNYDTPNGFIGSFAVLF